MHWLEDNNVGLDTVIEHLLSMCKTRGSTPSTKKLKEKREKERGREEGRDGGGREREEVKRILPGLQRVLNPCQLVQ